MDSSSIAWPEYLSKKLIKNLVQGKESATKLQALHKSFREDESISAVELTKKILASFTETISMLVNVTNGTNNNHVQYSSDHDHQSTGTVIDGGQDVISLNNPQEQLDHHSHCDDRSSEDSGESSKKRPAFKDRRGCYKRRKSSQSWSTVGTTIEDGQAWRKYGQKEILNSEYPRAYFRCTRKHDQGCKATKQVQQIQDTPKMYQTTYIGQHTCKHILKAPQMIIDSHPYSLEFVCSDHSTKNIAIVPNKYSKSNAPTPKEEQGGDRVLADQLKEETQISEENTSDDKSSFDTHYLWSGFNDIELSDTTMGLLSPNKKLMGSDDDQQVADSITFSFANQTNSGTSLISLDNMDDDLVKSIDFCDSDFQFDESEFPM